MCRHDYLAAHFSWIW